MVSLGSPACHWVVLWWGECRRSFSHGCPNLAEKGLKHDVKDDVERGEGKMEMTELRSPQSGDRSPNMWSTSWLFPTLRLCFVLDRSQRVPGEGLSLLLKLVGFEEERQA